MPIFGDDGIVVTRTGAFQYTITLDGNSSELMNYFLDFLLAVKAQMKLHLHKLRLVFQGQKMYGQIQEDIQEQLHFSKADFGLVAVNQTSECFCIKGWIVF